jgi:hypothetical protein
MRYKSANWRKWNKAYAEAEWKWYLSGSPRSIDTLGEIYGKIPTYMAANG